MLEAGRFYAWDRGYEKFPLFQDIVDAGSSFVASVRGQMTWTVLHERELSAAARQAGVVFDAEVNLGGQKAEGVLKLPYGVAIQVYTALIASLLITLWVGRKPTKRTYEMLCLYFQGWASLDELTAPLNKLKAADKLAR